MRLRIYGLFIARDDHGNTTASCGEKSVDCRWGSDTKSTADVLEENRRWVGFRASASERGREPNFDARTLSPNPRMTVKQVANEGRKAPRVGVSPFFCQYFW